MNRILYHLSSPSILIPLLFAPFTLLLIFSQNTVPGDLLYPYKRGVEIIILSAASLNPTTKAYFQTSLADRRYSEAEILLLANHDISALDTFVEEVRQAETAIANVSDIEKKEELKETLIAKIDDYQSRLTQVETQISNNQVTSQDQPEQVPFPKTQQQTTAVSQPTSTPIQPSPTRVVQPTLPPSPPPTPDVGGAIGRTKDELEEIKEKAKRRREEQREHKKEKEVEEQKELQKRRESQEVRQEKKKELLDKD